MKMKKINTFKMFGLMTCFSFFVLLAPIVFAAMNLFVPFTSQSPFGNWAMPWQEFCEEASVVMAAHFLSGTPLTSSRADREMQIVKQYEQIVFKKYSDTSAEETASILKNLYGFKNITTKRIIGASDIAKELSQGRIVIVPTAGRLLKNPHFIVPGPLYHMLVIKGFDDAKHIFITNDPGTRRGNGYVYDQDVLMNAIHDWNGGDVLHGEKDVIVVAR